MVYTILLIYLFDQMLRNQINPTAYELDQLNIIYPWLPNSLTCRPNHATLVEKRALLNISRPEDIVKWIFEDKKGWIFKPTQFRYNLPESTNHWILWNSEFTMGWNPDPEAINEIIYTLLFDICDKTHSFDFGWYVNPKPTVTQFFHIQVFWIKL